MAMTTPGAIHTLLLVCLAALGCAAESPVGSAPVVGAEELNPKSVDFYVMQLGNEEFVWAGPTAAEDRIPANHAARALAYLGDVSVVPLLAMARDEARVDKTSLFDALSEIGVPMEQYREEFFAGSVAEVLQWWETNRRATLASRTEYRKSIGLPAPDRFDELGSVRKR